jgi:farnesyl diphosphate synthase
MPLDPLSARWLARIEAALAGALPAPEQPPLRLHAAMRHAALGGGKRLRPQLVYAGGYLVDAGEAALDNAAVAVELIHAFSLVHDDLPAMDDDDLRRGRATVHVAFDEATAILAGDALQTLAFEMLAQAPTSAETRIALIRTLSEATGSLGMCGGQQLDMDASGQSLSLTDLETLHRMKTGALIRASVRMGALIGNADDELLSLLDGFAGDLGLAFQIRDDILDVEADSAALGKTAGKDAAQSKSTYPALLGLSQAKDRLRAISGQMATQLLALGERAEPLRQLARFAVSRGN